MQSCENFGHELISNYWQVNKHGKPSDIFPTKDLIVIDPSKIEMVFYSAGHPAKMERIF